MTRPTWDEYGLILATAAASRAACTRRQVGAVILGVDHRVVAVGYNGTAAGRANCTEGGCPRGRFTYDELPPLSDYSNCYGFHAERNAIEHAQHHRCDGASIYITREPCGDCRDLIRGVRIARAVWPEDHEEYTL